MMPYHNYRPVGYNETRPGYDIMMDIYTGAPISIIIMLEAID
jgi:hypothetical protein